MSYLHRTLAVLAILLPAVFITSPSTAEVDHSGRHNAGWMRVVCKGTATEQRCHLRVPGGFREMNTTYLHGGEVVAVEGTSPYRPHSVGSGPVFDRRVTPTVRVRCSATGGVIECKVRFRRSVTDFSVTTWSAGQNYGGPRAHGL